MLRICQSWNNNIFHLLIYIKQTLLWDECTVEWVHVSVCVCVCEVSVLLESYMFLYMCFCGVKVGYMFLHVCSCILSLVHVSLPVSVG